MSRREWVEVLLALLLGGLVGLAVCAALLGIQCYYGGCS